MRAFVDARILPREADIVAEDRAGRHDTLKQLQAEARAAASGSVTTRCSAAWATASGWLSSGWSLRGSPIACAGSASRPALEMCKAYITTRNSFGQILARHQMIQKMVAENAAALTRGLDLLI